MMINKKRIFLGRYTDVNDAYKARQSAERMYGTIK